MSRPARHTLAALLALWVMSPHGASASLHRERAGLTATASTHEAIAAVDHGLSLRHATTLASPSRGRKLHLDNHGALFQMAEAISYSRNDPANYVDPTGMEPRTAADAAAGLIGLWSDDDRSDIRSAERSASAGGAGLPVAILAAIAPETVIMLAAASASMSSGPDPDDVMMLTVPAALRAAGGIGKFAGGLRCTMCSAATAPRGGGVGRFMGQGFSPAQAQHLAASYRGMGHHFLGRRLRLPRWIQESRLNVLKPRGVSRGRFYELHFRADPYFYGTRFPNSIGGTWSGRAIGLQKPGTFGRLWYGMPGALKLTLGAGAAGAGAGAYFRFDE